MKITHVHRFHFADEKGTTVDFVPVRNVPGFRYRVVVNGKLVTHPSAWLREGLRPNLEQARRFYRILVQGEADE